MDASDKQEVFTLLKWLLILVGGAIVAGIVLMKMAPPAGPKTLVDANLANRVWSANEVDTARRVTQRQLKALAEALDEASRKGDDGIVLAVMPHATSVLANWNDQTPETKQIGRDCMTAALHLLRALDTAATPAGWSRSQFDAALADCSP